MPLQRVNNSFDSNDSKLENSVASEDLQGKGKFSEVFESASSKLEKKQKNDVNQKIKPAMVKTEGNHLGSKISEESPSPFKLKNEKLIGLKKIGSDFSKNRVKKIENSEHSKRNVLELSNKVKTEELGKNVFEEISLGGSVVINTETPERLHESLHIPGSINTSLEGSEAGTGQQLKSSVLLKSVSDEKKSSFEKNNLIKKDSKKSKGKISVLDLRHAQSKNAKVKQAELSIEIENKNYLSGSTEQITSDNNEESKPIVIELTHVKDNFSSESKTLTTSSSSALMKQLEENVNSKIVKQSSVILKDGGSGEIKLILKPEQLGKVRIKLSLTDNRIVGHIIVDSSAVKDVFEQNLQNLERAFKENGFDTAALNVSVGGDHSGDRERENGRGISKQIEMIDEIIPTMISESENLIDLVV
ncbi:MAG: flagellar hook-length control protein FliK [Spirochaetia bacterium]|jgi:flagellar hook-length control protein FliK|nr:flagellar hook-length control protein FliK [Spirochaetia bacterium]